MTKFVDMARATTLGLALIGGAVYAQTTDAPDAGAAHQEHHPVGEAAAGAAPDAATQATGGMMGMGDWGT